MKAVVLWLGGALLIGGVLRAVPSYEDESPKSRRDHFELGLEWARQEEWEEALRSFDLVVQENPDDLIATRARFNAARVLWDQYQSLSLSEEADPSMRTERLRQCLEAFAKQATGEHVDEAVLESLEAVSREWSKVQNVPAPSDGESNDAGGDPKGQESGAEGGRDDPDPLADLSLDSARRQEIMDRLSELEGGLSTIEAQGSRERPLKDW